MEIYFFSLSLFSCRFVWSSPRIRFLFLFKNQMKCLHAMLNSHTFTYTYIINISHAFLKFKAEGDAECGNERADDIHKCYGFAVLKICYGKHVHDEFDHFK